MSRFQIPDPDGTDPALLSGMGIKELQDAKSIRDHVRALLVKAIMEIPDLPDEVRMLLRADALATRDLAHALKEYEKCT